MKKIFIAVLCMCTVLSGCSGGGNRSGIFAKEGISPYELSEEQQELLSAFGMTDTSKLFSFSAPKEAITVEVNAYRLTDSGTWEQTGNGAMSIGTEREPVSRLSGTIAMEQRENYCMDFHISCAGQGSFSTEEITLEETPLGSTKSYLEEFLPIGLNQEIPVAVMVYDSGTEMQSYTPQDYFVPSVFQGMDLVQVVTVLFSEKEIGE